MPTDQLNNTHRASNNLPQAFTHNATGQEATANEAATAGDSRDQAASLLTASELLPLTPNTPPSPRAASNTMADGTAAMRGPSVGVAPPLTSSPPMEVTAPRPRQPNSDLDQSESLTVEADMIDEEHSIDVGDFVTDYRDYLDKALRLCADQTDLAPGNDLDQTLGQTFCTTERLLRLLDPDSDDFKVLTYKLTALKGLHANATALCHLRENNLSALKQARDLLDQKSWQLSELADGMITIQASSRCPSEFQPNKLVLTMQRTVRDIDARLPFLEQCQARLARNDAATDAGNPHAIEHFYLELQALSLTLIEQAPKIAEHDTAGLRALLKSIDTLKHYVVQEQDWGSATHGKSTRNKTHDPLKRQFFQNIEVSLLGCQRDVRRAYVAATTQEIDARLTQAPPLQTESPDGEIPLLKLIQRLRWLVAQNEEIEQLHTLVPADDIIPPALRDIADRCQVALQQEVLTLKQRLEALAQTALDRSPLSEADTFHLMSTVRDLPLMFPSESISVTMAAERLCQAADNLRVVLDALIAQAQLIAQSPHLSSSQKQDMLSWLCRLADNKGALMYHPEKSVTDFAAQTQSLLNRMTADRTLSQRLANQVEHAAHNAACTDWAAMTLIDLLAIAEDHALAQALTTQHLKQQPSEPLCPADETLKAIQTFVTAQKTGLMRLTRYAAFKAYMQEQASQKESVEMGLYLYRLLQAKVDLPGDAVGARMQYGEFAEQAFGRQHLEKLFTEVGAVVSDAHLSDLDQKCLLLDTLSLFDLPIWDTIKTALTDPDANSKQAAHWADQRTALHEQLNRLDYENPEHASAISDLQTQFTALTRQQEAAHANGGPNAETLKGIAALIQPDQATRSSVRGAREQDNGQ